MFASLITAILVVNMRITSIALILAPSGTYLRVHLTKYNLPNQFPYGTFIANLFACIVLYVSVLLLGQTLDRHSCALVSAIIPGFCGCLSTLSTFILELKKLPLVLTYKYAASSLLLAQVFAFVVIGSYQFSGHSIEQVCAI